MGARHIAFMDLNGMTLAMHASQSGNPLGPSKTARQALTGTLHDLLDRPSGPAMGLWEDDTLSTLRMDGVTSSGPCMHAVERTQVETRGPFG